MKVQRIKDVRELLRSHGFEEWFGRYTALRQAIVDARERSDDLLAQSSMVAFRAERTQQVAEEAVFEAGELENAAEQAQSEYSRIENDSFEAVSAFETQRQRASDTWQVLSGLESQVEEVRQRGMDLRARAEAARRGTTPEGAAEASRIETHLADVDADVANRMREIGAVRDRLTREESERDQLWRNVEESWSRAFEANMARSEYEYRVRCQRGEIERLFAKSAAERQRVGELKEEAKSTAQRVEKLGTELDAVLSEARKAYGCTLVRDFMFWPRQDNVRVAFAVPLIDDATHLNIQVSALSIYQVERAKGLDFLEPVPEQPASGSTEDPRLESFFFEGRPAGSTPPATTSN